MQVNTERLDKVKVAITIEVDEAKFEEAVQSAYKAMVGKINVPGFRKGKAPKAVIEKSYGPEIFYENATEQLIPRAYVDAVKTLEDIQPIGRPEFEIVQLEAGKPFIFKAIVDTKQEVNLGEYKGIELTTIEEVVTEEEIDTYLNNVRKQHAQIEVVEDGTIENGDTVVFDFCGKKDGVAFPGGTANDYSLEIGSGQFIPGFEEQMVGMKTGEEKNLELTFPAEYHAADLAGQDVIFEVKVKEIKRKKLAELDDEFAKDVSEFETFAEYKENAIKELQARKDQMVSMQKRAEVTEKVAADTDVVAPESMVENEAENYLNDYAYQMRMQGIPLEKYLELTGGSLEDLKAECRQRAEIFVKQQIVLEAIAEKEEITVSDEEMDVEYAKLAEMYNQPVEQVKQMFIAQGYAGAVKRNILLEKVADFLIANAKIG